MIRPGRNDACWCGSGLKYKRCHSNFDDKLESMRLMHAVVPSHKLIKTPEQIAGIKESAKINIAVLDYVAEHIKAGITTEEIDKWVYDVTTGMGGIPAPLNYEGFPKSVCTSIDNQVCHGMPSPGVRLREGDAKESLNVGLSKVKPWGFLGDVGQAINDFAKQNGYSVVREIGGHGVGLEFHEDPFVSYVSKAGTEMVMAPGLMFTIEPMINMGRQEIYIDEDNGWTAYTEDRLPSAQWEIQVLVTEEGYEIISY